MRGHRAATRTSSRSGNPRRVRDQPPSSNLEEHQHLAGIRRHADPLEALEGLVHAEEAERQQPLGQRAASAWSAQALRGRNQLRTGKRQGSLPAPGGRGQGQPRHRAPVLRGDPPMQQQASMKARSPAALRDKKVGSRATTGRSAAAASLAICSTARTPWKPSASASRRCNGNEDATFSPTRPGCAAREIEDALITEHWEANCFGRFTRSAPGSPAVRLSPIGPLVLLADHLQGDIPILIYRVERLESAVAALRDRGWTPESGPFEVPNGPCHTFRDPLGVRLAIYENQRPEVVQEFAGRIDSKN